MSVRKNYPTNRPVAVDFFSGAGGMSLGFEQAGFDILLSVDQDAHHTAAHKRNFPYGKSICASVTDLKGKEIIELLENREVDLIFGGPPCQGFSQMGGRDVSDERNTLVYHFGRLISEIRPKAFVMENVPGMQMGKTKSIFDSFVQQMEDAGYSITLPPKTLLASDFGAPQARERLIVLGVRKDQKRKIEYPKKAMTIVERSTVGDALSGLPIIDGSEAERGWYTDYPSVPVNNLYARISMGAEADPFDLSRPRLVANKQLSGCKSTKHSPSTAGLYAATAQGKMVPGHKLPKLNPDGVSPTLRAGTDSDRGAHTAPRPVHPIHPRVITAREAARLHSFPDWFGFYPSSFHAYRQIGNAVCPLVARAVGYEVARALGVKYTSSHCEPVVLDELYDLPFEKKKPGGSRRISHKDVFPRVFEKLIDAKIKHAGKTREGIILNWQDVETAVNASDAEMPLMRAERFFDELARLRNIEELMKPLLDIGLSLRRLGDGTAEVVSIDHPSAMHNKFSITINSAEIREATRLSRHKSQSISDVITTEISVNQNWFNGSLVDFHSEKDLFGGENLIQQFYVKNGKIKEVGIFINWLKKRAPDFSDVAKLSDDHGAAYFLFSMPITTSHRFVSLLNRSSGRVKILRRAVFDINEA